MIAIPCSKKNIAPIFFLTFFLFASSIPSASAASSIPEDNQPKAEKLYWFIPDGMRADPELFNVFEWAKEGKLPNIKKMMDNGAYGYSIPVYPSHTPVNFASLLTGSYPKTHGVADGPMHVEGHPLNSVSVGGFSSVAKKVPPIWINLEESGKDVVLLSIPGSTPPELNRGITIRGRWGGWGADFHAINFQSKQDLSARVKQARASRLFFFGPELTRYIDTKPAGDWPEAPVSFSPPLEARMNAWGSDVFAYIYDSLDDGQKKYDRIAFSLNKKTIVADLGEGDWSAWTPISLRWKKQPVDSDVKMKIIKLSVDDEKQQVFFRVRLFYNNLNRFITKPSEVAEDLIGHVGPMVDFVDNFPPQLIYYPEDKQTFLEEAAMSFQWHQAAAKYIIDAYNPDVLIQDIYTPNQMLTSRWWLGYIDPVSKRYDDVDEAQRSKLRKEVLTMYKELDKLLGEYLELADKNTLIVLSSDHGAVPLNKWVRLNNLFARQGLLKFTINKETGEPVIDWAQTKVIYLKMDNIYIDPNGLAGNWERASGPAYEKLRDKVIKLLKDFKDENGENPVAVVVKWEDVQEYLDLPKDRVGDLIIANKAGYGWNEEVTASLDIFTTPLKTGYKQAILPQQTKGMWTPFIIVGPGVKKNHEIKQPLSIIDQYPTIMHLLGMDIPDFVEGRELKEIYEKKN